MPIQHKTGNRHIASSAAPMVSNIFHSYQTKGQYGPLEVITTVTETTESFKSEVKLKISCTFCEKSFGNPGAFECHRLMKHPGRREMGDKICLS